MLFNSFDFLYFFAGVYAVYRLLPHRARNLWLLLASYFFYGYWDYRFLALLFVSTGTDFVCGLRIGESAVPAVRRRWLAGSVVVNLGILGAFKYFGFFVESLERLALAAGWTLDVPTVSLVLPVGISFYTFQSLGYTIDVYRGRRAPTRRFLDFALFVAFFPQLVAGPIERASKLLPQIERPRTIRWADIDYGLWLIVQGYFLKLVVADNLAPFVDAVFDDPGRARAGDALLGIYAFPFQVYGDFAGYSRIARGVAKLLGFELSVNFVRPHLASSPAEQWTRWHVTLSRWFRYNVFVPLNSLLGGARGRRGRSAIAAFLTLCASGLWHGAAWHFVLWGAVHGVALVSYHRFSSWRAGAGRGVFRHGLAVFLNFNLWCWVAAAFRAPSAADLPRLMEAIGARPGMPDGDAVATFLLFAVPLTLAEIVQEVAPRDLWSQARPWVRELLRLALFIGIVLAGATGSREFVYFQF